MMKTALILILNLNAAWANPYGGPERVCGPGAGVTGGFQAIEDFMQDQELCSSHGGEASAEDQESLLDALRLDAVEKYNVIVRQLRYALPPTEADAKAMREQVAQVRTLLALQQTNISARHSPEEIAAGKAAIDVEFPSALMHSTGFAVKPDPLTEAEMERARKAIANETAALGLDLQRTLRAEIDQMTALGINPMVQASNVGGDKIDAVANTVRANSKAGYQTLIAKDPWILFVKQPEPSRAQLIEAKDAYVAKLNGELEWMRGLKIDHPPDEAALALLFNTPSVASVVGPMPERFCPAFNALKQRARDAQKFRELTTLAVGIGGGAACLAASVFSAGLAGAGCLAVAATEFGVASAGAASQFRVTRALYAGVLQGGSMDEYQASQSAAQQYLIMAGLSGTGLALAGGPQLIKAGARVFYKPYFGSAAASLDDVALSLPTLSRADDAFPKLLDARLTKAAARVNKERWLSQPAGSLEDIPLVNRAGGMISNEQAAVIRARLAEQPEGVRNAALGVYNRMQDKAAFNGYMVRLVEDSAAEIRARGIASELADLEKGIIPRNAALRVLVKRAKLRGDGAFSTVVADVPGTAITRGRKPGSNAGFRDAVLQGPFFDKPLGSSRHGIDMHLLQRDYVSSVINDATGGNPRQFWDFIGSKKGINMWVPLFDADPSLETIAAPEFLRHQVLPYIKLK